MPGETKFDLEENILPSTEEDAPIETEEVDNEPKVEDTEEEI